MRRNLLILLAFGLLSVAEAQKAPLKYGDIPDELLKMTSFPADSSAEAVVIADYGTSEIVYSQETGFQINFERTRRIKVLTEAGKNWANLTIQLYRSGDRAEKLLSLKGITVNLENGKAVESKLEKGAIFRDKYSKNYERIKATLPNIKVGSVFDIVYQTSSDFLFNFQDWEFQSTIPVVWSEYRASIPEYFTYDKYMQGYISLKANDHATRSKSVTLNSRNNIISQGGTQVNQNSAGFASSELTYMEETYRWVASDVPAFRDEPYMTTRADFVSRMNFELTSTKFPNEPRTMLTGSWTEINQRLAESTEFLGEVNGNGFLKKLAEELTASAISPSQKIDLLHSYVRTNIEWDGDKRMYTDKNLKQVIEDKKGNSAEINLLLASMIEKLGIPVKPVVISTRDNGFIRENTPAISQFNYTICLARFDNTQILLDATEPLLPSNILPSRCLNGKGFAVAKESFEWVNLEAPKSREVISTELQLSEDGTLGGVLKMDNSGYGGLRKRRKFSVGSDAYLKELIGARNWQISKSEYTNERELKEAFKEKHDLVINDHVTVAGDVMYLSPFISSQWLSNPFKAETREYPVDFGSAFDEVYMAKIKIPAGFVVDEMPAPKAIALPGNAARYTISTTVTGDIVNITSMLIVNKPLYSSTEYDALREFYNQLVAKQTEQIVIKRN